MANFMDGERGGATPLEVAMQRINEMVNGKLDLTSLDLTILPPLPKGIRILKCSYNRLIDLPPLPPTLVYLDCGYNQLTTLPALPPTLGILICSENQLSALPTLPSTLKELYSGYNNLIELPALPPTLKKLYCDSNQLTTLPPLPPTLEELQCAINSFIKPFQDLIDSYEQSQIDLPTLISSINTLHAEIETLQSQGRSVQAVNLLTRQQWDPTKTSINMGNVLQGNVGSLVSSMLTGREGSTEQQMTLLRGNAARLNLPGTALTNIAKANALKKIQNQRKKGGSRKKTRKSKKSRKTKKE